MVLIEIGEKEIMFLVGCIVGWLLAYFTPRLSTKHASCNKGSITMKGSSGIGIYADTGSDDPVPAGGTRCIWDPLSEEPVPFQVDFNLEIYHAENIFTGHFTWHIGESTITMKSFHGRLTD
jgi:hypothetical protein